MQLEQFGVDTGALKEPAVERIFGHGSKIGRRTPERRMIVLRRHVFLQSIKDLFSMIQTQGVVHFLSGIETCGFVEGEVMAMVCGWC